MLAEKMALLNKSRTAEEEQQLVDIEDGFTFIKNIRKCSAVVELMDPIPENYRSDEYWT
jgi:hypothetical protein